ncbi:MAG TPA: dynamin family protein [Anaerolineae bacterium]|nr:dynamin family protein [Anaerolineae bacterium]
MSAPTDRYQELRQSLTALPHVSPTQVDQWVNMQQVIDQSRDYLIRAVPEAQVNIDTAQKILAQKTYTLVFFGGTGVGKSTLINSLLGRNLLPTGAVTAVTGTIVYIEQAAENEQESLVLSYWSQDEFAQRVSRLCQLADVNNFDITNAGEREQARADIAAIQEAAREEAKTDRDEYIDILIDCLDTFENHQELFKADSPPPQLFDLNDPTALEHLREDGYKGSDQRQIRIVRSATFKIHPHPDNPNLLMNGYLRIVDVPGLGAGMRLHEEITLEEMKREDAMIVLVTDAGRQRIDEMKSLAAVNWIKEHRLSGLSGVDLDEAAAKIFVAVNGANVRQAYDRLTSGNPESEREVREVTRHIAPNYWERYRDRGQNRPYFLIMAPPALYVQDPDNAPSEFASETERIAKVFSAELGDVDITNPLDEATAQALLNLSEVPHLRQSLINFITNERVRTQLREASSRVRTALSSLRQYYQAQLAERGMHPPFEYSWETLQERRYENLITRHQKNLPRIFHNALLDLSKRTNSDSQFRRLVRPSLDAVRTQIEKTVQREIESLLDNYGTEYWDDRDVTYDNLVWGNSGIEVPIKRILFQVELVMHDALANAMPQIATLVIRELESTLASHEVYPQLERANYGQDYTYTMPQQAQPFSLDEAYQYLIEQVAENFKQVCRQATMYEMMSPNRSVSQIIETGEQALALPTNERLLDVALNGVEAVQQEMPAPPAAVAANNNHAATRNQAATDDDDEFTITILDPTQAADDGLGTAISFPDSPSADVTVERSYADKLDNIADKTNRIFANIITNLFNQEDLLPRLRRLFWLETTKAERDINNLVIKPMLRQHDRSLQDETLRLAMEPDLESVSDIEELLRVWEGLDGLDKSLIL